MKLGVYAALAVVAVGASAASAASVYSNTFAAQLIGTINAGQAYTVAGTGTVNLCGSCNNGGPLTFNPNGTVASTAYSPYAAFNSGPLDHDPSQSSTSSGYYGYYGAGVYLGALYGSFTATPMTSADLFLIGSNYSIAAGAARTLYGVVNDSNYSDNPATAFTATLSPAAASPAPEPATWAMMVVGFGTLGVALRRRKAAVRFA